MTAIARFCMVCCCAFPLWAGVQEFQMQGKEGGECVLREDGTVCYWLPGGQPGDTVEFRADEYVGPSLWLDGKSLSLQAGRGKGRFEGESEGLRYALCYVPDGQGLRLEVECENISGKAMDSLQLSLRLGINTEMDAYPHWRKVFFPTLLRCEKTHFWGYLMNPDGRVLVVASPDPVASWHLHYNNDKELHSFGHGHRIRTLSLDLVNPLPLPERHPALHGLKRGEKRSWEVCLEEVPGLDAVGEAVCRRTGAPFGQAEYYTVAPDDTVRVAVTAKGKPALVLADEAGNVLPVQLEKRGKDCRAGYEAVFCLSEPGRYALRMEDGGKVSEMVVACREGLYSDYVKAARRAALRYPQKASTHTESWYGFFSAYLARCYFPDAELDAEVDKMFWAAYPLMYDTLTNLPLHTQHRIQNHAMMAALCAARYRAGGDSRDLERAAALADFICSTQQADGSYRSGRTHYTSVIYVAKALMEVMEQEKPLAQCDSLWRARYEAHYVSVKRAIDDLALHLDNIQTEGEMTFEDGMISCSYTQISQFALLQPEGSPERRRYTEAAEKLCAMHRCLSQLVVPDARMHGGSLRFWEAQYDILTFPDMLNSPHGWTAWRIYGLRNLYLLTGKYEYLRQMVNAMGTCLGLMNPRTAELHWAFVCDPYVEAAVFVPDEEKPGQGKYVYKVIGEQYMPMISDWYRAPMDKSVSGYWKYDGGCCDNDVHEIFKCLGEILLTSAYVCELPDGTLKAINCHAWRTTDGIAVEPAEACIRAVHLNLAAPAAVTVRFQGDAVRQMLRQGWVAPLLQSDREIVGRSMKIH